MVNLSGQRKEESKRLYRQGLEDFLAGNQEKAVEAWQKAVELDPANEEARKGLERIQNRPSTPE
jgi:cytochrome c-type biogenesis protein CcmH/NrfG